MTARANFACFAFALVLATLPTSTSAATIQARPLTLAPVDGPIAADVYRAPGAKPRPAVIVLHGASGIEPFAAAYVRYATSLASHGFDAYLVSYFSPHSKDWVHANPEREQAIRMLWRSRIGRVVYEAKNSPHASGSIGLLGFSLGGQVALSMAGSNNRV